MKRYSLRRPTMHEPGQGCSLSLIQAIEVADEWTAGRAPTALLALKMFETLDHHPGLVAILSPAIRQEYLRLKAGGTLVAAKD